MAAFSGESSFANVVKFFNTLLLSWVLSSDIFKDIRKFAIIAFLSIANANVS